MTKRPIKTVYYRHDAIPVVNSASDADRAVMLAVSYMRSNQYNAHTCEVYNTDTGVDHVAIRWTKAGVLEVVEKITAYHPTK